MMITMSFAKNTLTPNTMAKSIEVIPPLPIPPKVTQNMGFKRRLEALSLQGRYYDQIGLELSHIMMEHRKNNLTH